MFRSICSAALDLLGWKLRGERPDAPRYVLVGAPHTSNWDFLLMVAFTTRLGMKVSWIGKHTLFRPPLGMLFRSLGGIPIDRTKPQGLVEQVAEEFARQERLILLVTPEGTRGRRLHWKTGFYHIARKADVPIALGSLDYPRRLAEFSPLFRPCGDMEVDFERIRRFFDGKRGKHPENMGEIRPRPREE